MNNDLFALINEWMPKVSKGHKKIAEYILVHYDKAAFMTAAKLGETVGVSESTVVRFASELGFDGYPGLQKALQDAMRNKLTAVQRIEVSLDQIKDGEVFRSVLMHDIEHIRHTLEETAMADFDRAVENIVNAEHVYVMGIRSSAALASFLGYYFKLMLPNVVLVQTGSRSELYEQLMRLNDKDVLIGISFPRYSKQTVHAISYAHNIGAKSIAITDSLESPIASNADNVLVARSDMVSFVDSLVAPLSLINALIVAVSIKNKEVVANNFAMLEEIWEEYDVYQKNGDKNR